MTLTFLSTTHFFNNYFERELFFKGNYQWFKCVNKTLLHWSPFDKTQRLLSFMLESPYRFWQDGSGGTIIESPKPNSHPTLNTQIEQSQQGHNL